MFPDMCRLLVAYLHIANHLQSDSHLTFEALKRLLKLAPPTVRNASGRTPGSSVTGYVWLLEEILYEGKRYLLDPEANVVYDDTGGEFLRTVGKRSNSNQVETLNLNPKTLKPYNPTTLNPKTLKP
jgi:hypothetical protein